MRLLHEINGFAASVDATLTVDGGDIGVAAARHLVANRPGSQLSNASILGSLGPGLPFAIGAKAAAPDETVICVTGDGAFGLGAMEIDTAVRLDLPFICVIGNDLSWGMIRRAQSSLFGKERLGAYVALHDACTRLVAAKLGDRPYEKMVEALGGYGERVEDPEEIRPALERARESGRPACLNVMIDPKVTG